RVRGAPEVLRRVEEQRVVLAVERARRTGGVGEGDALGDDAAHAGRLRGAHEMAGALAAQAVVDGEVALDLARVDARRQRGELVHDGVGRGGGDRRANRGRVE